MQQQGAAGSLGREWLAIYFNAINCWIGLVAWFCPHPVYQNAALKH
jgi:hypothetical protein